MPLESDNSSRPNGGRAYRARGAPTAIEQQVGEDARRRPTSRSGAGPPRSLRSGLTNAPYDSVFSNTLGFSDGPPVASSSSRTLDDDFEPPARGKLKMSETPRRQPTRRNAAIDPVHKPQHRNASQQGSTKQSAIDLSDDDEQGSVSSSAAQRDSTASTSSAAPKHKKASVAALSPEHRPRRTLALSAAPPPRPASVGKRRSPPEASDSESSIAARRRKTNLPNDDDFDSTFDELDLLGPHNDSPATKRKEEIRLAPPRPQGIKDRMRDKNHNSRDTLLGQVPSKTLGTQQKVDVIPLTCIVFGDQKALTAEAGPTLSLRGNSRSLRLGFTLDGRERSLEIQLSDCASIEIADNAQLQATPLMQLYVQACTLSATAISKEISSFDPKGSSSAILCRSDSSHAQAWTSIPTVVKSVLANKLGRLGASAVRAILEAHQKTIDRELGRRKLQNAGNLLPRTALTRESSSLSPPPFLEVRKRTTADSQRREEDQHTRAPEGSNGKSSHTSARPKAKISPPTAPPASATRRKKAKSPSPVDSDTEMAPPPESSRTAAGRELRSASRNTGGGAGTKDELMLRYPLDGPGSVSVLRSDFDRLEDGQFLNDTIVEFGLKYHLEQLRQRDPALYDSLYVFNSFFYPRLAKAKPKADDAYQQVRKWTSKFDVFSKKYLVIPINENMHWYLAIVLNPGRALEHLEPTQELSASPEPPVTSKAESRPRSTSGERRKSPSPAFSTPTPPPDRQLPPDQIVRASTPVGNGSVAEKGDVIMSPLSTPSPIAVDVPDAEMAPGREVQQPVGSTMEEFRQTMDLDPMSSTVGTPESSSSTRLVPSALQNHVFQSPPLAESQPPPQASPPTAPSALDSSSGIQNEGRGSIVGGGPGASPPSDGSTRKKPVSITPGESLKGAISRSPIARAQYGSGSSTFGGRGRTLNEGRGAASTTTFYSSAKPRATEFSSSSKRLTLSPDPPPARNNVSSSSRRPLAISRQDSDSDDGDTKRNGRTLYQQRRKEEAAEKTRAKLDDLAVLTFDSLGSTHPTVKTAVTHWLRNEAWDKKQLRIAPKVEHINVAVPGQSNFCDCGLYVLLYFERFFRDPEKFTKTIIPMRDSSKEAWDAKSAGTARSVLRSTISDLSEVYKVKREEEEAAAAAAAAAAATMAGASANGEAPDPADADPSIKRDENSDGTAHESSIASVIETGSAPEEGDSKADDKPGEAAAEGAEKMDTDKDGGDADVRRRIRPERPQDSDVDTSADADMEAAQPPTEVNVPDVETSKSKSTDTGAQAGAQAGAQGQEQVQAEADKALDLDSKNDDFIATGTAGKEVEQAYERGEEHKNGHDDDQEQGREVGEEGEKKVGGEGGEDKGE